MEDYNASDEQVEILEGILNSVAVPKATRASAGFVLHRGLEKRKEYDRADGTCSALSSSQILRN